MKTRIEPQPERPSHCSLAMTIGLCFLIQFFILFQTSNSEPDTYLHLHVDPQGQGTKVIFLSATQHMTLSLSVSGWYNSWFRFVVLCIYLSDKNTQHLKVYIHASFYKCDLTLVAIIVILYIRGSPEYFSSPSSNIKIWDRLWTQQSRDKHWEAGKGKWSHWGTTKYWSLSGSVRRCDWRSAFLSLYWP